MKFPQVVRDLLAAREVLIERGWCQHYWRNRRGQCCSSGALIAAVSGDPLGVYTNRSRISREYFEAAIGSEGVAEWNDRFGRRRTEVLAAFDEAASLALSEAVANGEWQP